MNVKIAKEAGFCFGVKRAMKMAWDELEENSYIYALGPLIHNKQAVKKYEERIFGIALSVIFIINPFFNFIFAKQYYKFRSSKSP